MIGFHIRYKNGAEFKPAAIRNVLQKAYARLGLYWHRNHLPKHFANRASSEYDYAPRQGERGSGANRRFSSTYTGGKLKRYGHTRPLELSGASRRQAEATATVRATSKSVRVSFQAGNLSFSHPSGRIDMRKEIQALSAEDRYDLGKYMDAQLERLFKLLPGDAMKKVK